MTCISTDISSWPAGGFLDWVNGVSSNGTFICPEALGTDETIQRGVNYCPAGWTVVNTDVGLQFTAKEANSTLQLSSIGTPPSISLLSSDDGQNWGSWDGSTITL